MFNDALSRQMQSIPGPTPTPVLSAVAVLLPAIFNIDLSKVKTDELIGSYCLHIRVLFPGVSFYNGVSSSILEYCGNDSEWSSSEWTLEVG